MTLSIGGGGTVNSHESLDSTITLWPRRSAQRVDLDRGASAGDHRLAERAGIEAAGERLHDLRRGEDAGVVVLVEALEAGGDVNGVADHRVLAAPLRADRAGQRLADVEADADAGRRQRPGGDLGVDSGDHVERGGGGVASGVVRR